MAAVPTVTGYTTNGWYTSAACTTKATNPSATTAEDIIVYASKVAKTITVKYHVNGGTVSSASHKSGSTTYYHAVGSDSLMRYSTSSAVTASSAVYSVKYSYKTSTFNPVDHATFALKKTGYTPAEKYTLNGTTGTPYGTSSNATIAQAFDALIESGKSEVVLYAVYNVNTYTITLDKNGGTGGVDKFYEVYGSKFYTDTSTKTAVTSITVPTRTGYTFNGYYSSENSNDGTGTPLVDATGRILPVNTYWTANATIYAKWTPKTYTITLDKNGGTGGVDKFYEVYGSKFYTDTSTKTAITSITVPTRTGYTFNGYYSSETSNDGTGTPIVDASGNILVPNTNWTSNATIYAKWTVNVLKIGYWTSKDSTISNTAYKNNNGDIYTTSPNAYYWQSVNYNDDFKLVSDTTFGLARTGYVFTGWKLYILKSPSGSQATDIATIHPSTTLKPTVISNYVMDYLNKNPSVTSRYGVDITKENVNVLMVAVWASNVVSVDIKKDDTAWTNAATQGLTSFTLVNKTTGTTFGTATVKDDTSTYTFANVPNGTYIIKTPLTKGGTISSSESYIGTIVVNNNNPTVSLDYYSVTVTKDAGISSVAGGIDWIIKGGSRNLTYTVKTGYHFKNWTGTHDDIAMTPSTATKYTISDIHEKWVVQANSTPNTYTVHYNGNGATGGSTADSTHVYDVAKNLTTNGFVRKYTVTYKDAAGNKITSYAATATTANATWNGWAKTATDAVAYGPTQPISVKNLTSTNGATVQMYAKWTLASITLPTPPTKTGYIPTGWVPEDDPTATPQTPGTTVTPEKDTTYIPKYTPIIYYVKYNGNGATSGSMSNSTHTYDVAKNLTKNAYKRVYNVTYKDASGNVITTYSAANTTATATFNGWAKTTTGAVTYSDQQSVKNLSSTNKATVNIYAKWTLGSVTLPTPPDKTGYIPTGWVPEDDPTATPQTPGTTVTPEKDTTFIPTYTPIIYYVKYNKNGATSGSMSNSTHTYDVAKNLTKNAYKRVYNVTYKDASGNVITTYSAANTTATATFNGWAKTTTGAVAYADQQSVKNLSSTNKATVNIYAKWTLASITLPTPPDKEGYVPTGWVPEDDPTATPQDPGTPVTPTKDTTFIPKYTPIIYYVKYNKNGATSGSMANSTYTYDVTGKLSANKFARVYNVTYKDKNGNVITGYAATATKATATMLGWGKTASGATVNYPEPYSGNPVSPYTYNNVLNWSSTNKATVNIYAKWELGSITLPDLPDVPGYKPEGWVPEDKPTDDPLPPDTPVVPTKDTTYIPKYTPIVYTLTYKPNGGKWVDNTTANKTLNFTIEDIITLRNDLTKTGYVLDGWKVTSASTGSWVKNTTYESDKNLGKGNWGNVTLTANWIKQLYLEPIDQNAPYTLGTDVISSFYLHNPTDTDRMTNSHVNLTFKIYDGDYLLETKTLTNVVVPAGKKQLVWIKWSVPAEINNQIRIVGYIHEDAFEDDFGEKQKTYTTTALDTSYPNPFNPISNKPMRNEWTRDKVPGTPTCATTNSTTWTVWEEVGGALVEKTYGITANGTAVIRPDDYATHWVDENDVDHPLLFVVCPICGNENYVGVDKCDECLEDLPSDLKLHTRSGYGIVLQAQAGITTASGINTPDSSAYTGAQTAIELRPEYQYKKTVTDDDGYGDYIAKMGTNKTFVTLDKVDDVFMFVENPNVEPGDVDTRYLPTELWFSTGMHGFNAVTYAVMIEFSDIWTPNGMLTLNAVSNELGMAGTVSDDDSIF